MKKLFAMALIALFVASTSSLVLADTATPVAAAAPAKAKTHKKKSHKKAAKMTAAPAATPAK